VTNALTTAVVLALALSMSTAACVQKGPAQKAGRAIDRATGN
jgi:predicted small lipoprotein YifL